MSLSTLRSFILIVPVALVLVPGIAFPQESGGDAAAAEEGDGADAGAADVPEQVNVDEVASDVDIEERLQQILEATGWFEDPEVVVEDGVAFLRGTTNEARHSEWATRLAGNTEDVVAVVNRLRVTEPPLWDISPAVTLLNDMARSTIQSLPLVGIAIVILVLTWLATKLTVRIADASLLSTIDNRLLHEVSRKAIVIPVVVLGLYLVLTVLGLSRLAVTVIGGTGLFGLVLGVAFRDIMENFLASILLSIQNPFKYGDVIEVDGQKGIVQRVNTRGTLLMTFDGNHIQIPNATIYKNVIKNYTANPNLRLDFVVGVGYDASVSAAQELAMQTLHDHPAVLNDPPPMVLVEELGAATVNLRVYFWVDGQQYSGVKVKSSLIRQTMRTLEANGISMPDEARELVFPKAVPVQMLGEEAATQAAVEEDGTAAPSTSHDQEVSNDAEGDFVTETHTIRDQARKSRDPEEGQSDLLDGSDSEPAAKTIDSQRPTATSA
ncbi:Small-conductance mechanosensitive channel [Maioricimonas rarisocia]|uniref:Small-conductance mechanosensitive channel n=1 Tax=Maioricimonas rarisocia TaxID=2528026 RepID=A0A517Z0K5_9PLAN|nr:mechanosensitive ion channel family protein [Maioricimonas rarisocia]QDU36014.1 Small-conductance mechanosensitive channel [Maioricimonas rarisocia]